MNKFEAYSTYLAENELETLMAFGKFSEENKQQSFRWYSDDDQDSTMPIGNYQVPAVINFTRKRSELQALDSLGYLIFKNIKVPNHDTRIERHITFLPATFYRYNYERKSKLGKWFTKTTEQYLDVISILAFIISIALAINELFFQ